MSADQARPGGDIIMISGVNGSVSIAKDRSLALASPNSEDLSSAIDKYSTRLYQRYGRLDLEVLTPLREQNENPTVELSEVFVAQAVRANPPPVELPRELVRRIAQSGESSALNLPAGIDGQTVEMIKETYFASPQLPVLSVLAGVDGKRIVLLGDPGSGKSTLAKYLAIGLTAACRPSELLAMGELLPLIIELRTYAEANWREETFESFLEHSYEAEGLGIPSEFLIPSLTKGEPCRILLIFDGLDEIFESGVRDAISRRIAGFASRYPMVRIIVTSRVIGYQRANLDGAGFAHFMLQDLDREQIAEFTRSWFDVACPGDPAQSARLGQRVISAVDSSPSVQELAGNPLILTILAIIGRRRELPRDRRTVYEHAVEVLAEHWDPSKYLRDQRVEQHLPYLGMEDKLELLRLVARRMQEGSGGLAGNHIAGNDLIGCFQAYLQDRYGLPMDRATTAARIMLQQFRERNFILSRFGGEVYGFVHRTFLEYLAATEIAHRFNIERSLTEVELIDVFLQRRNDPAWHEVLLLLTSLIDERFAAAVIDEIIKATPAGILSREWEVNADLMLAIRFLGEVRRIGLMELQTRAVVQKLIQEFEGYAAEGASNLPAEEANRLERDLASFGPSWSGRQVFIDWHRIRGQYLFDHNEERYVVNSLQTILSTISVSLAKHDGRIKVREMARQSSTSTLRTIAVEVLAADLPSDSDTIQVLLCAATEDPSEMVRGWAVRSLARHCSGDPSVISVIRDRVFKDESEEVRDAATWSLGFLSSEPDVLELLVAAASDVSKEVRGSALWILAEHWSSEPRAADIIREAAAADPSAEIRSSALRLLRRVGIEDAAMLALCSSAVGDPAEEVRITAVGLLADNWQSEPDAKRLILQCVENDAEARVREAAVRELIEGWPDEPGVQELALRLAERDPDPDLRGTVMAEISDRWVDYPHVYSVLRSAASDDADGSVREIAMRALVESQGDEPLIRALIGKAIVEDPDPSVRESMLDVLGEYWHADPATPVLMRSRLVDDPDWRPRLTALEELAGRWAGAVETVESLRSAATGDPVPAVRVSALRELIRSSSTDGKVLELILERASNDSAIQVRLFAMRALAHGYPEARETVPLLKHSAESDDATIQCAALVHLAEGWPTDPGVRDLLGKAATSAVPSVKRIGLQMCELSGLAADHRPGSLEAF